jgi:hypothetical protein
MKTNKMEILLLAPIRMLASIFDSLKFVFDIENAIESFVYNSDKFN